MEIGRQRPTLLIRGNGIDATSEVAPGAANRAVIEWAAIKENL
jgi:hypothetical protein